MFSKYFYPHFEEGIKALSGLESGEYACFASRKHSLIILRQSDSHFVIFDSNPVNPAIRRAELGDASEIIRYHLQIDADNPLQFEKINNPFEKPVDEKLLLFNALDITIQNLFIKPAAVVDARNTLFDVAGINRNEAYSYGRLFPALREKKINLTSHDLVLLDALETANNIKKS